MAQIVKFLDAIGGNVLLDVSPGTLATGVVIGAGGVQAPPPPMERVVSSTPLAEGGLVSMQPVGLRTVTVPLSYTGGTPGATAMQARRDAAQALMRVLGREDVWLELRPDGLPESRYLHCYRSADPDLTAKLEGLGERWVEAVVKLPADPYAYGPKETALGTVSTTVAGDLRATITGSSVKGDSPAPLVCKFSHPGGGGGAEQFSIWLSSHHAGTGGAHAKVLYDLTAAGGTLPGTSTRNTKVDASAVGGSSIVWDNVTPGQTYRVSEFTMTGPAGGAITGRGTYRAFAIINDGNGGGVAAYERWRISLRVLNDGFGSGETEIASGEAVPRAGGTTSQNIDKVVDLGLVDIPFAGRDTAVGLDAPASIAAATIRVYATCVDNGGGLVANTDMGFDAIVLLPADDSLALVQYVTAPTARDYYLDPFSGGIEVRDNSNLNVAAQPFVNYSGGAPYVVPGVDTSIAMLSAVGGYTAVIGGNDGYLLPQSFSAIYWPRYLVVA